MSNILYDAVLLSIQSSMGKIRPCKEGTGKYKIPRDISSLDPSVLSQGVVTILSCVGDVRLDVKEI